jgi:hypothetical protein
MGWRATKVSSQLTMPGLTALVIAVSIDKSVHEKLSALRPRGFALA